MTPKRVLVVVDMIKGFVNESTKDGPCKLYVKGAASIIPNILREMENANEIIYVCDMHDPEDKEFEKWGKHAVEGTEECEVVDELLTPSLPRSPYVMGKKRFSGFYNTPLARVLKEEATTEVVIAGVCTDICVFLTALDACYRDYKVTILRDCVFPLYPERGEALLKYLVDVFGVTVI